MTIENFYIKQGNGFPLILLHGNAEDSTYFGKQIEEFSKYYEVYAIDTRGHGKTPMGNKPFTLNQFAEDLLSFMNGKNIEKAHILGFSDGGNIAVLFALLHPERVEKLILNGANLSPDGLSFMTRLSDFINYNFACLFSKISKQAKYRKDMLSIMVNEPNINPDDLQKINSETLVIAGTKDLIKKEHTKLIANNIPNSKLVFLEGNHFVVYNEPEKFNKVVLEFLGVGKV